MDAAAACVGDTWVCHSMVATDLSSPIHVNENNITVFSRNSCIAQARMLHHNHAGIQWYAGIHTEAEACIFFSFNPCSH
jgi:hypothetical protein